MVEPNVTTVLIHEMDPRWVIYLVVAVAERQLAGSETIGLKWCNERFRVAREPTQARVKIRQRFGSRKNFNINSL